MVVIHAASSSITLRLFVESLENPEVDSEFRFLYLFGKETLPRDIRGETVRINLPRGYLFFFAWLSSASSLQRILREKPDVLHVHTPATALGLIWVLRGLSKKKVRLVYTARGGFDEGRSWVIRALWHLVDPLRWRLWDAVGVVNPVLEAKAQNYDHKRVVKLLSLGGASPNFAAKEPTRRQARKDSDGFVIRLGWVGRFSRDKRPSDFLRLLSLLRDKYGVSVEGIMMGGADRIDRARVDTRLRDDVIQLGWVRCPQEFLVDCDLLISTSVREGYGLVPVESAMVGTPTIAYETFGTLKSVPEVGGRLVPARDIKALARAVFEWAGSSYSAKELLRDDVRKRAQELVSGADLIGEMTALYRSRE